MPLPSLHADYQARVVTPGVWNVEHNPTQQQFRIHAWNHAYNVHSALWDDCLWAAPGFVNKLLCMACTQACINHELGRNDLVKPSASSIKDEPIISVESRMQFGGRKVSNCAISMVQDMGGLALNLPGKLYTLGLGSANFSYFPDLAKVIRKRTSLSRVALSVLNQPDLELKLNRDNNIVFHSKRLRVDLDPVLYTSWSTLLDEDQGKPPEKNYKDWMGMNMPALRTKQHALTVFLAQGEALFFYGKVEEILRNKQQAVQQLHGKRIQQYLAPMRRHKAARQRLVQAAQGWITEQDKVLKDNRAAASHALDYLQQKQLRLTFDPADASPAYDPLTIELDLV